MKTVDEVVSEWTREERERFRDLIEECREREEQLIENSKACRENLTRLTGSMLSFFMRSFELNENVNKLGDDLFQTYLRFYNNKKNPLS